MRRAQRGGVVWAVLVLADVSGLVGLGLVTLVLAFAPLVVVPLGLSLLQRTGSPPRGRWAGAGALAAAGSLLLPQGGLAAAVAGIWLAVCLVAASGEGRAWISRPCRRAASLARIGALVYLCVGAAWLAVDRLGARPLGLPAEIVELTAVHFHYAGFGATLVAGTAAMVVGRGHRRAAELATLAVLAGSPVVAAGFAAFGALQVAGAVLLTAGLWLLAWVTVRSAVPRLADRAARRLLVISSVAVVVPMLLAVQWAVGHNWGTPALSIPAMARYHGVVNAFGFTLCGLLGWLRAIPDRGTG